MSAIRQFSASKIAEEFVAAARHIKSFVEIKQTCDMLANNYWSLSAEFIDVVRSSDITIQLVGLESELNINVEGLVGIATSILTKTATMTSLLGSCLLQMVMKTVHSRARSWLSFRPTKRGISIQCPHSEVYCVRTSAKVGFVADYSEVLVSSPGILESEH
jgi:hypothetical protein